MPVANEERRLQLVTVRIEKPAAVNFILGQAHFIKTVDDLHEAVACAAPGAQFGVAFCEASPPALVRWSGTSGEMIDLAKANAMAIGAGHSFVIFLSDTFPVQVLNAVKMVPEVCGIFCATANQTEVILAETGQGRAILGVADGVRPAGFESGDEIVERRALLRRLGYKV